MKILLIAATISLIGLTASAQTAKKTIPAKKTVVSPAKKPAVTTVKKPVVKPQPFKTNLDSASYALGVNVGSSFKSGGLSMLNFDLLNKGIRDVFAGANPTLTQQQCQEAIQTLFEGFSKEREELAKKNEEIEKQKHMPTINEGATFLAQNKSKEGIKSTESGLQYEVIVPGTGAKPTATDRVTVHYKGTLLSGLEFDSSYKRGEPATFGLNQVISGWTEGVQLMQEGAKYRFFIPYNLAYGGRGAGEIPPFSTLIFEIELIKVGGE
ncbi:FKBP-type peptidyl-prolyl cis-trans isomerase [Pedobacter insulae]|uniref:Peptidyl-prolyl cis-trans isomerase n=1 Tax=Pedobacter insulae TaxID=414048 RepID=A0A1I2ZU42_9SPHI|nr:FKBP-type peptidyl-prolyl cis-trans isomerase [Pedobacter insulae]SFH41126.1 FKBP-type peptidyl-prolyl cis-trans isomerase FklB [Pedobacter insulae]